MTRTEELRALAERVAAGSGSNAEIAVACRWRPEGETYRLADKFPIWRARQDGRVEAFSEVEKDGCAFHWSVSDFLGSLDACAALHKATLGDLWVVYEMRIWPGATPACRCELWGVDQDAGHSSEHGRVLAEADTAAQAWTAAILRACAVEMASQS